MRTGVLWNQVVTAVHAKEAKDVELQHILADACAMQLVRNPKQFDVIVCDNLFGDMLSDEAAMLTGSIGMLPSASLGAPDAKTGKRKALYEPVHGSAPDIAGKGLANPIAAIASYGMALRYSCGLVKEADLIDNAIAGTLAQGFRTGDIMQPNMRKSGTAEMGQAILDEMEKLVSRLMHGLHAPRLSPANCGRRLRLRLGSCSKLCSGNRFGAYLAFRRGMHQ